MAESKLMEKYPFLKDIWNSYNFDKPVDNSQDNRQIITICSNNQTYGTNSKQEYKTVCKYLLKNLKILSNSNYRNPDNFYTGCKNLNNWLYFKEKELAVSSDIINKIFQAYKQIKNTDYHSLNCEYSTFDKEFNEKEKLINLRIFNDNSETIQGLLRNNNKSDDCSLKRYVYKCIEVYREMNSKYCSKSESTTGENRNSCDIINEFNRIYWSYIYNKNDILHKFPDLSSKTPTNVIVGCPSPENTADSTSGELPQTGTSMRGVVSPALGVMAGMPPFLALIYNFTPVRKIFSFRNKRTSTEFSSLDEKVENELIIQQLDDTRKNSVHPKYNVAYGPV